MSNFTTENLIPYTGTIQPGQRLIKRKNGTFLPIGVAGASAGTSMNFYKCASVLPAGYITVSPQDATSDTGSDYYISASSEYGSPYAAWRAFSGESGVDKGWFSGFNDTEPWIQIQFSTPKVIEKYEFGAAYDSSNQTLSEWTLKGSNNGTDWAVLDTQTGQSITGNTVFSGSFQNLTAYTYYRLSFPSTFGYGYIGVQQMQLLTYNTKAQWTGYKAGFDAVTGAYSYEATATTGLTYSLIIPEVGKVYADGALIEAKLWTGIPENGLIRYASMNASAAKDELGNNLYVDGSPTFAADSGIPCAEMTDSLIGYQYPITALTAYSLNIWMKRLTGEAFITFSGGNWGPGGNEIWIRMDSDGYVIISNGAEYDATIIETTNTFSGWVNIILVWTGSVFRLYVNGTQQGSDTQAEYSIGSPYPFINSLQRATGVRGTGKYAAFLLYNRVLTPAEIAALAAEFTPNA